MKTLADLKRVLVPGKQIRMVSVTGFPPCNKLRTVIKQQSALVLLITEEGRESRLDWPASKNLTFTTDGFICYYPDTDDSRHDTTIEYKWVNE